MEVEASSSKSANGTADKNLNAGAAKAVEVFVHVTAGSTPDFDYYLQASPDETNWVTVLTDAGVTITSGTRALVLERGTEAIGKFVRFGWTRNSGSATFSAVGGVKE